MKGSFTLQLRNKRKEKEQKNSQFVLNIAPQKSLLEMNDLTMNGIKNEIQVVVKLLEGEKVEVQAIVISTVTSTTKLAFVR